jgi:N-acetylglucosaminyldiphosphoundecaprenol N-acetyl-beta-D-mannosaminyltransferase
MIAVADAPSARVQVLGCPVDALDMPATVARCIEVVERGDWTQHMAVNVAKLVSLRRDERMREIVAGSGLISADGQGVVWGARLLGVRLPGRVAGIDLMDELLGEAARRGWRVFILGARRDVLDRAIQALEERHLGLIVAGSHDGYFSGEEEPAVCAEIRESRADLLFVAMSTPRKELFLAEHGRDLGVALGMGVGGAIDVVAGVTSRAPEAWQRAGMEWLYRLLQEPRRMFRRYATTNARFALMLAAGLVRRSTGRR